MTRKPLVLLAILAVGITDPASADCGDDPNNLMMVANCDFDDDETGWTAGFLTTIQHISGDGNPELGALELSTSVALLEVESPCFEALPSTSYGCGGFVRVTSGSPSNCSAFAFAYSGPSCGGGAVGADPAGEISSPPSTWSLLADGNCDTNASTGSLRLRVSCTSSGPASVLFDNFFVGPGLTVPVELQSFSVE